ncbi:hypothetical protein QZH41_007644 [Actinostola sp. cb2023]|nr:hypothetical protein QZH41_007644 [Actinostola sp. cb2023]
MDPLIFCGLCGVASAGVGYVVGSALFRSLWKIFNKDTAMKMEMREVDYLERISSKRAASFSKFEDDYYGESIKTLSDYRQWLREQEKKRKANEKFEKKSEKEEQGEERTAEAN